MTHSINFTGPLLNTGTGLNTKNAELHVKMIYPQLSYWLLDILNVIVHHFFHELVVIKGWLGMFPRLLWRKRGIIGSHWMESTEGCMFNMYKGWQKKYDKLSLDGKHGRVYVEYIKGVAKEV